MAKIVENTVVGKSKSIPIPSLFTEKFAGNIVENDSLKSELNLDGFVAKNELITPTFSKSADDKMIDELLPAAFKCEKCTKTFRLKYQFRKHQQRRRPCDTRITISPRGKPQCDICVKEFSSNGDLRRHIQTVHNDCKCHPCNFCGKCFKDRSNLNAHVSTLHGEKKLSKCNSCAEY